MASTLQLYTDFANTTPSLFVDGKTGIINEAGKHSWIIKRALLNRSDDEVFATGNKAKVDLMFDENSTFRFYNPNSTFTPTNPQVLDTVELPLRYAMDYMAWNEQEIMQNIGKDTTKEAKHTAILSLWYSKAMRKWTSMLKGVDAAFWADMHNIYSTVEGNAGDPAQPYSYFAFATENTYDYHPQGWTNIETLDPATESGWRNPVQTYDHDDRDDSDEDGDGLKQAFTKLHRDMNFELPGTRNEYFERPELQRKFFACGGNGIDNYNALLAAGNDRTFYKSDLSQPTPTWMGVDIVYQKALDDATIYDNGGTGGIGGDAGTWTTYVAEASATYDGPRYYCIDADYIHPIIHPDRFFHTYPVKDPTNMIGSFWQPTALWYNIICKSRQMGCGVICPKA